MVWHPSQSLPGKCLQIVSLSASWLVFEQEWEKCKNIQRGCSTRQAKVVLLMQKNKRQVGGGGPWQSSTRLLCTIAKQLHREKSIKMTGVRSRYGLCFSSWAQSIPCFPCLFIQGVLMNLQIFKWKCLYIQTSYWNLIFHEKTLMCFFFLNCCHT